MEAPPQERGELTAWFSEKRESLLDALSTHGEHEPAWVFVSSSPQVVGWWARRQALETSVHRFDLEAASGRDPAPVEAELAVTGVDEFLNLFLPRILSRSPVEGLRGSFHVHATDAPGEWSLDLAQPGLTRREHSKADTAVRGPASGLYLWMWNRVTPERGGLEVFGDASVIEAWRDVRM
jgi:uncharacterized protein (TIGR03083 family)